MKFTVKKTEDHHYGIVFMDKLIAAQMTRVKAKSIVNNLNEVKDPYYKIGIAQLMEKRSAIIFRTYIPVLSEKEVNSWITKLKKLCRKKDINGILDIHRGLKSRPKRLMIREIWLSDPKNRAFDLSRSIDKMFTF